ncbi:MAG: PBP1A family penicillin-binding protein [Spirochaetota bacterium]
MKFSKKRRIITEILLGVSIFLALFIGVAVGLGIAMTKNIQNSENLGEYKPALPTQILDRHDNLITEIFAEEKRDIISIDELPKHLLYALITREDQDFFNHHGFSLRSLFRAAWNIVTRQYFSGSSTITQQIAGALYCDRTDISIRRKLKELWYSLQLERSLTKMQILELYMNKMYFGHNTYGVETASQFYFGHSARQVSLAESAMLVIQLASPALYSPINNPDRAKKRQYYVLQQMVKLGYTTQEEADASFQEYWENYDYTRSNITSAYFENVSKAPYFSEYVRQELEGMLFGALDINRDGFVVHTTLDLNYQKLADDVMNKGFQSINTIYRANTEKNMSYVDEKFVPVIEMLSLSFNLEEIRIAGSKEKKAAKNSFQNVLNPALDILSMMFNISDLKLASKIAYSKVEQESKKTTVEGALITLENDTGHILAMVGGSEFKTKKLNRAVQAKVMPGSAFKPLYYSAAVSSKKFTPSTLLYDAPVIFWNDDGTPYTPVNYMGEWKGPVLLRYALAKSMNVPSIQVLDGIGFDTAISSASKLLGITDPQEIAITFPRRYPLGLGIIGVAPIQMARAFASFANEGKEVEPIGIIYVEDRRGSIILEPEKELRARQKKKGSAIQIMTPQAAYIMVDMLKSTVDFGTLAGRRELVGGFTLPMAGKTGTTQNWSDAWTVGFSPYITTAVWFGFDLPGNSLGINQTGATSAGPIWAEYMKEIHKNLPYKDFQKPETGLVELTVCAKSGLLPTEDCNEGIVKEIFLAGTEPRRFCNIHKFEKNRDQQVLEKLQKSMMSESIPLDDFNLPDLDVTIFKDRPPFPALGSETETENKGNPLLD